MHDKRRGYLPESGHFANLFHGKRPDYGRFVHAAVIKPCRHSPVQLIQETQKIIFRCAFNILSFNGKAFLKECFFSANIWYAIHVHKGITALSI